MLDDSYWLLLSLVLMFGPLLALAGGSFNPYQLHPDDEKAWEKEFYRQSLAGKCPEHWDFVRWSHSKHGVRALDEILFGDDEKEEDDDDEEANV